MLLGGDHKLCLRSFATPEAIQRTELIEYARMLGNTQYSLPQIQPFKLLYAFYLADLGMLDQAKK